MILSDFPPEIIHNICECLEVTDVRIFRLACRTIGATAACHAFPELTFYLHNGDFDMLRHFANHPIYSKHVKSIVYPCDMLWPCPLSFGQIVAKMREREEAAPSEEDSEESLRHAYQRYEQDRDAQKKLLDEERDRTVLNEAIPKFHNLKDIMVSNNNCFRQGEKHKKPFDDLSVFYRDNLNPIGFHYVTSLLSPLVGLPTIQLRSLRLGMLDDCFIREVLGEPAELDRMIEICRNLTTFEIHLNNKLTLDEQEDMRGGWSNSRRHIVSCSMTMRKGLLRPLLGSMTHLENLTIDFTYPDPVDQMYPAKLSDLIPEGMCWENLKHFSFTLIEATRPEMVDFIRRHRSTVRRYSLGQIQLIRSTWREFLPDLRHLALEMSLDDVLLSDEFAECDNHSCVVRNYMTKRPRFSDELRDYILQRDGRNDGQFGSYAHCLE